MSTEYRQKRLIGWAQYIGAAGAKGGLYSIAVIVGGVGLIALLVSVGIVLFGLSGLRFPFEDFVNLRPWNERIDICLLGGILCGISLGAISFTMHLGKVVRDIEPVALLTRHNTGNLPEIETLVRSSDLPLSQQKAELLRATRQGAETTANQLLRAVQESSQDG